MSNMYILNFMFLMKFLVKLMDNPKVYFSIPKVAKMCGVSRTTLWGWVKSGYINSLVTPGGHHRILKEDVEKIFQDNPMLPPLSKYKKKVLIIDNDLRMNLILKKKLCDLNYYADAVHKEIDAGIKLVEVIPDLVILNCLTPEIDSFEICRKIKDRKQLALTKIIVMSRFDSSEIRKHLLKFGADSILIKSENYSELIEEVGKVLGEI